MKIQLATKPLSEIQSEYLVIPVYEEGKSPVNGIVTDFLADNPKFGKLIDSQLLYSKARKLLLLGLGKKDKVNFETIQNWAGAAVKQLLAKTKSATILAPQNGTIASEDLAQALTIGIELAAYDPSKNYKSDKQEEKLTNIEIIIQKADRAYQEGLKKGQVIAESIVLVKRLGDMPANEMTPTYFLNEAKKLSKENKLKLSFLTEAQAKKKGMGAFVGVAQGSDEPSYMIALEYAGDYKSKEKWGIVGKGITFDTGGLNLKPDKHMNEMHYDMCGAAASLGVIAAVSKLGLKTNVVSVMAVTENFPSGKAQRPGDIVRTYSGKTAEVANTDAEGRLVLADALTYAQKDFKATKIIDLATLTGAIIVALGDHYTGAFGNNSKFTSSLIDASSKVGERVWEMPMDEIFDELVKSEIADLYNIGKGGSMPGAASSIAGAKFLEAIIENDRPWIHLDIAGTATDMKPKSYKSPGATGALVKTLVKLISEG